MKKIFALLLIVSFFNLNGQVRYAVELIDKSNERVNEYIQSPKKMLSQKALDRRESLNISLDAKDVPIDHILFEDISKTGAIVLSSSKWLNTIFIDADDNQILEVEKLAFVKSIYILEKTILLKDVKSEPVGLMKSLDSKYGYSEDFIKQIKIDYVHDRGYNGDGVEIAVLDAGFIGVDTNDAFKEIRDRGAILGTYNFVDNSDDVYKDHYHGSMVLSTMGVNDLGTYVGSAFGAKFWLFLTEDISSETPMEEFNWIEAAEFSDSIGVDIINTSLGYNLFDDPYSSYTQDDLDGKTSYVSRGAEICASRGILVVVSAGNEGKDGNSWKSIMMPSDAINVLCIGAVDASGFAGNFSSYGPSSDDRVKPDVAAMGVAVPVYNEYGKLKTVNGTSFSSPITAGSLACLRQAFPKMSVADIIEALHETASIYDMPDDRLGYGIANFRELFLKLEMQLSLDEISLDRLSIFPNPVIDVLKVKGIDDETYHFSLINSSGKKVFSGFGNFNRGVDMSELLGGVYQIVITDDNKELTLSFIKTL
ncbi:MAG: S8 family serine peptidase [Flavobacteriales bacterium]|nr:S8 family serine peptidase [Flavobacteriales bacterium]